MQHIARLIQDAPLQCRGVALIRADDAADDVRSVGALAVQNARSFDLRARFQIDERKAIVVVPMSSATPNPTSPSAADSAARA